MEREVTQEEEAPEREMPVRGIIFYVKTKGCLMNVPCQHNALLFIGWVLGAIDWRYRTHWEPLA